jgi:hypothetical protein
MKKYLLSIILTLLSLFTASAQSKYWIFFKDKPANSSYCISEETKKNREILSISIYQETDKAVNDFYIQSISQISSPIIISRWLNAVSVKVSETELEKIKQLDFIEKVVPVGSSIITANNTNAKKQYSFVQEQIKSSAFKDNSAQNITIGVIDAGFYFAHKDEDLKLIFENNRVKQYRDYVSPLKIGFYAIPETALDNHGTMVLKQIAGFNSTENKTYGCAYNANFYLARTDHGVKENRREEDYWVAAMEWMDSVGVRIINTSLGYAKGFDLPEENYKTDQMNGKTSVIARAAQLASVEKGILLIISAGNEGADNTWKIISTPADAPAALTVGATYKNGQRAGYSSIGPDYNDYLKPEVSCFSNNGTSFSAPVVTGIAACIMNMKPELKANEIKDIITNSAHLYPYGNNFIGYGIPDCEKIVNTLNATNSTISENKLIKVSENKPIIATKNTIKIEVKKGAEAVIYHKSDKHIVISTDRSKAKKKKISISQPANTKFTTLDLKEYCIEIEW